MIFTFICIGGFLFVCCALPFALRYEAARKKQEAQSEDYGSPADPLLEAKCPGHPLLYLSPWKRRRNSKEQS